MLFFLEEKSISPIDILIIENEQEREKVASELEKNDESLKNLIQSYFF
jgi:hypothetical protein